MKDSHFEYAWLNRQLLKATRLFTALTGQRIRAIRLSRTASKVMREQMSRYDDNLGHDIYFGPDPCRWRRYPLVLDCEHVEFLP